MFLSFYLTVIPDYHPPELFSYNSKHGESHCVILLDSKTVCILIYAQVQWTKRSSLKRNWTRVKIISLLKVGFGERCQLIYKHITHINICIDVPKEKRDCFEFYYFQLLFTFFPKKIWVGLPLNLQTFLSHLSDTPQCQICKKIMFL